MKTLRNIMLLIAIPLVVSCHQTQISGSTIHTSISIAPLGQPGNVIISTQSFDEDIWLAVMDASIWFGYSDLVQIITQGIYSINKNLVDANEIYLATASGGEDLDADRDGMIDASPNTPARNWHAILPGEILRKRDTKVSVLTEAVYRWLEPELTGLSDADLRRRLDLAAEILVGDYNEDGIVSYKDITSWSTFFPRASVRVDMDLVAQLQDALVYGASDATVRSLAFQMLEGRDSSDFGSAYWRLAINEMNQDLYISDSFLYDDVPDTPYSLFCDPGTLSPEAKARALEASNATRALHGLAAVTLNGSYEADSQEAALIQKANNYLSHFPAVSDACFTSGGAAVAASANLGLSSNPEDPLKDIIGWTNDSNNVSTLAAAGHRRWLVNPFASEFSYGQVAGGSALKVFSFTPAAPTPSIDVDHVAFPNGTYPYPFMEAGNSGALTPWSFTVIEDKGNIFGNDWNYFSSATISVTRRSDGAAMTVSDRYSDTDNIGVPNFLSWNVVNWEHDTLYDVEISGVNMQLGGTRTFSYWVYVDYAHLVILDEPLESGDSHSGTFISGRLANDSDRDSYTLSLSGNVTFSASSQFSNWALFLQLYGPDKQLIVEDDDNPGNNGMTVNNLAAGDYTLVISNCNAARTTCYSGLKDYTVNY